VRPKVAASERAVDGVRTPLKVAVLAGGRSSEHPVSLDSARSVLDGLEAGAHECVPVLIDRDGSWRLADPRAEASERANAGGDGRPGERLEITPGGGLLGVDVAFPVLHGPFGEDGTVQGLLECVDVPYVGAGVLASALCMDKVAFKRLMAEAGVPQVRYEVVTDAEWRDDGERALDRARSIRAPRFVKPPRQGSSFGISKVTRDDELPAAIELALEHDACALVEAGVSGLEVECSVIGNSDPLASEPGEVVPNADWYDYEAKYTDGGMDLVVPARIAPAQRERVRRLAIDAFTASGCTGLARVDFFVTDEGQVLVNELNTIPGFTGTSVFARLFEASGIGYVELLDRLLALALERHAAERKLRF
jgi:D-alanine-D-alanine ligase